MNEVKQRDDDFEFNGALEERIHLRRKLISSSVYSEVSMTNEG